MVPINAHHVVTLLFELSEQRQPQGKQQFWHVSISAQ